MAFEENVENQNYTKVKLKYTVLFKVKFIFPIKKDVILIKV